MRNASTGVKPLSRLLSSITCEHVWMPNHKVGSAADKTQVIVNGEDLEATLYGTNTNAYDNVGWLTGTGNLVAAYHQTDLMADLMNLQTLGTSGSLLICCDIQASANPSANVSLWGRSTVNAATNGGYHARATTAGVIDVRMTAVGGSEATISNSAASELIITGARQSLAFWFDCVGGTVQIYSQGNALGLAGSLPSLATRPKRADSATNDYGLVVGGRLTAPTTVAAAIEGSTAAMRIGNVLVARFEADQTSNIASVVRDIARFPWAAREVLVGLT